MAVVYVVGPDGDVVQREVSFEIGTDEAYKKDLFDVSSGHNTNRKGILDAWQMEMQRGSEERGEWNQTLKQQLARHVEEMHDQRVRAVERLEQIFANNLQMSGERMGAAQGAQANQMLFDPQKVAESAIESGLANTSQTQGNISAAIAADVAETLKPSIVAMGDILAAKLAEALSK